MGEPNSTDPTLDGSTLPAPGDRSVSTNANLQETLDGTSSTVPRPAVIVPEIDGYEITGRLGEGGMGVVWKATQHGTHRAVALKLMSAASFGSERARLRFQREVDLTARLEHPHIARVYDGGENHGICYYAMEFIDGVPLDQHVRGQKLGRRQILELMKTICEAVQYAHQKGVIHRDLKPANILVDKEGNPRVLDFGLAKALSEDDGQMLSMDMGAAGTPAYMSPEQAAGHLDQVDTRSDVYTLGVILFYLLSGKYPHDIRGSALEVMKRISELEPCRLKDIEPRADRDLEALLTKTLSREPERRYGTAGDFAADLERYLKGEPVLAQPPTISYVLGKRLRKHRVSLALAVAVLAVLLGMAVWSYMRIGSERNGAMASERRAIASGKQAADNEKTAIAEQARAERALSDLKSEAPALLRLGESDAEARRFPDAVRDIDAALALDSGLLPALWQRAWALIGWEHWSDAVNQLQIARDRDPVHARLADILPAVEKLKDITSDAERWNSPAAREVFHHLQSAGATGPMLAFLSKLTLTANERRRAIDERLSDTLGRGAYDLRVADDGLVELDMADKPLRSLDALRGLPIDKLHAWRTQIENLEGLRGMPLQGLSLADSKKIADLTPLRGMPLHTLQVNGTAVSDISPLAGMPLTTLALDSTHVADLEPLRGMRLTELRLSHTPVLSFEALRGMPLRILSANSVNAVDLSPLQDASLEELDLGKVGVSDLTFLKNAPLRILLIDFSQIDDIAVLHGLPLERLGLKDTRITDLTPLENCPLKELEISNCRRLKDRSPILKLSRLERLKCDALTDELLPLRQSKTLKIIEAPAFRGEKLPAPRTAAAFWAAYDEHAEGQK